MAHERRERYGEVERVHVSRAWPGRPLIWTSVYRVGDALVDSGCSTARPVFARLLRERAPRAVLTTHEHEDHVGNHVLLPPDVAIHAPATAKRFLDEGHPPFPLYRRVVWGYHEKRPGARLVGDKVDVGGRAFRVVPTPGHSADHVAYLDERENALFSGDAYMGRFKAARLEEDLHEEIASLRRMAALDPAMLFPAHGPALPRPRARLLDTADHFEGLAARARAMREAGRSVREIRRALVGREPPLTFISGGEFSATKLIANLLRAP